MARLLCPVYADATPLPGAVPVDIGVAQGERTIFLLGPGGSGRECATLAPLDAASALPLAHCLPVLMGAGLGHALEALLERTRTAGTPLAVVDKEADILAMSQVQARYPDARIHWVTECDQHAALNSLTRWQNQHNGLPLIPLLNPAYLRLDRTWYKDVQQTLQASTSYNFWGKAATPRFTEQTPRILLITSKYFLVGEMVDACKRLGYPHHLLTLEQKDIGGIDFVERLLKAVVTFRPDCVLTMNHLGVDREGVLTDLLARLHLPMGSWFVDNPHLILHLYHRLVNPWTVIFSWDADNLPSLRALGFEHVFHLPLGTDPQRFAPTTTHMPPHAAWRSDVSFVGNSMVYKVGQRLKAGHFPAALLRGYHALAAAFSASDERSVRQFILEASSAVAAAYDALPDNEARLAYEAMITWEATRQYRAQCVEQIMLFNPLIVGDKGWQQNLKHNPHPWRMHSELSYYSDLPQFYQWSDINFNCTSKQMKGAVNQRLFDVPAAGAFVLTDWRDQMDTLFEPGKEVICYHDPEEVPELVRYYLRNPQQRQAIVRAARRRVLAEHTWDHRLRTMVETLRSIYA